MLALHYRKSDMFTDRLTTPAMIAIVQGCHAGTSVFNSITGGWTIEANILADICEQDAKLIHRNEPYNRVGVVRDAETPTAPGGFEVTSIAEFEARRSAKMGAVGNGR